jgi:hypothetical protein
LRKSATLDVLAPITARASGPVKVDFHAAGRRTRFSADINSDRGRLLFQAAIPPEQAARGTGIMTLMYPGNDDTRGQEVRLRAAARHAELQLERPALSDERLEAEGTISQRARGVVRLQLSWSVDGRDHTYEAKAQIRDGRWLLNERLPAEVMSQLRARDDTVHSYTLFTGYLPAGMRGEMRAYEVLGKP